MCQFHKRVANSVFGIFHIITSNAGEFWDQKIGLVADTFFVWQGIEDNKSERRDLIAVRYVFHVERIPFEVMFLPPYELDAEF